MFQGKNDMFGDISFILSIFAIGILTEKWYLPIFVENCSIYAIY